MTGLQLIRRGDDGYEQAREDAIWNARVPDRSPDVIARAHNEDEVVEALALARSRGWRVAIRSGGHNFVGNAIRDEGMLLDLSAMRAVEVDEAARIARVEPAADNEDLIDILSAKGLSFTVGHCPSVALGGFLLGGGLGFNTGEWGYATENVVAVDVVTADGRRLRASEEENADLFWAARGSGPGFFGVVTKYHIRLGAHPNGLWSSSISLPLDKLEEVFCWLDEVTPALDPRVEPMAWIGSLRGHEIGFDDASSVGSLGADERVLLLNSLVYADTDEEAQVLLAPLRDTPFEEAVLSRTEVKTSFEELFEFQRLLYRKGRRYAVDCHWTDTPPAQQPIDHLVEAIQAAPSARTHVLWQLPFGNYRKQQPDMAASILGRFFVSIYAVWEDPADDDANISWLRAALAPFESISTGHYAGDVDLTATATRPARTLAADRYARYRELKDRWDPESLFHLHLGTPTG